MMLPKTRLCGTSASVVLPLVNLSQRQLLCRTKLKLSVNQWTALNDNIFCMHEVLMITS